MEFTPNFDLPCLSNEDYAGYALYMKCLAEQLDAEFTTVADGFDSFLMRPSIIWTATNTITFPANIFGILGGITWNVAVSNWPEAVVPTSPGLPPLNGWWYVGANVNVTPTGAVTGNSQRLMRMTLDPLDSTTDLAEFFDNTWESSSAGGENLLTAGTVRNTTTLTTPIPVSIDVFIFHTNASDLTTTLTPAPRVWAFYLGEQPEIEVPT